jgi:hypothetical protein
MAFGRVSMRNEDGTQWAEFVEGNIYWGDCKRDAGKISETVFDLIKLGEEDSKKNDCPDNGFFGIYNLTFHPIK